MDVDRQSAHISSNAVNNQYQRGIGSSEEAEKVVGTPPSSNNSNSNSNSKRNRYSRRGRRAFQPPAFQRQQRPQQQQEMKQELSLEKLNDTMTTAPTIIIDESVDSILTIDNYDDDTVGDNNDNDTVADTTLVVGDHEVDADFRPCSAAVSPTAAPATSTLQSSSDCMRHDILENQKYDDDEGNTQPKKNGSISNEESCQEREVAAGRVVKVDKDVQRRGVIEDSIVVNQIAAALEGVKSKKVEQRPIASTPLSTGTNHDGSLYDFDGHRHRLDCSRQQKQKQHHHNRRTTVMTDSSPGVEIGRQHPNLKRRNLPVRKECKNNTASHVGTATTVSSVNVIADDHINDDAVDDALNDAIEDGADTNNSVDDKVVDDDALDDVLNDVVNMSMKNDDDDDDKRKNDDKNKIEMAEPNDENNIQTIGLCSRGMHIAVVPDETSNVDNSTATRIRATLTSTMNDLPAGARVYHRPHSNQTVVACGNGDGDGDINEEKNDHYHEEGYNNRNEEMSRKSIKPSPISIPIGRDRGDRTDRQERYDSGLNQSKTVKKKAAGQARIKAKLERKEKSKKHNKSSSSVDSRRSKSKSVAPSMSSGGNNACHDRGKPSNTMGWAVSMAFDKMAGFAGNPYNPYVEDAYSSDESDAENIISDLQEAFISTFDCSAPSMTAARMAHRRQSSCTSDVGVGDGSSKGRTVHTDMTDDDTCTLDTCTLDSRSNVSRSTFPHSRSDSNADTSYNSSSVATFVSYDTTDELADFSKETNRCASHDIENDDSKNADKWNNKTIPSPKKEAEMQRETTTDSGTRDNLYSQDVSKEFYDNKDFPAVNLFKETDNTVEGSAFIGKDLLKVANTKVDEFAEQANLKLNQLVVSIQGLLGTGANLNVASSETASTNDVLQTSSVNLATISSVDTSDAMSTLVGAALESLDPIKEVEEVKNATATTAVIEKEHENGFMAKTIATAELTALLSSDDAKDDAPSVKNVVETLTQLWKNPEENGQLSSTKASQDEKNETENTKELKQDVAKDTEIDEKYLNIRETFPIKFPAEDKPVEINNQESKKYINNDDSTFEDSLLQYPLDGSSKNDINKDTTSAAETLMYANFVEMDRDITSSLPLALELSVPKILSATIEDVISEEKIEQSISPPAATTEEVSKLMHMSCNGSNLHQTLIETNKVKKKVGLLKGIIRPFGKIRKNSNKSNAKNRNQSMPVEKQSIHVDAQSKSKQEANSVSPDSSNKVLTPKRSKRGSGIFNLKKGTAPKTPSMQKSRAHADTQPKGKPQKTESEVKKVTAPRTTVAKHPSNSNHEVSERKQHVDVPTRRKNSNHLAKEDAAADHNFEETFEAFVDFKKTENPTRVSVNNIKNLPAAPFDLIKDLTPVNVADMKDGEWVKFDRSPGNSTDVFPRPKTARVSDRASVTPVKLNETTKDPFGYVQDAPSPTPFGTPFCENSEFNSSITSAQFNDDGIVAHNVEIAAGNSSRSVGQNKDRQPPCTVWNGSNEDFIEFGGQNDFSSTRNWESFGNNFRNNIERSTSDSSTVPREELKQNKSRTISPKKVSEYPSFGAEC